MASLKDYFEKKTYKPTYFIGDRVIGRYEDMPIAGTVGNDTLINEYEGPYVIVHLDLPVVTDLGYKSIVKVKHSDIRPLKELKL